MAIAFGKRTVNMTRAYYRRKQQYRSCGNEPQAELFGRLADKNIHVRQSNEVYEHAQALCCNTWRINLCKTWLLDWNLGGRHSNVPL